MLLGSFHNKTKVSRGSDGIICAKLLSYTKQVTSIYAELKKNHVSLGELIPSATKNLMKPCTSTLFQQNKSSY